MNPRKNESQYRAAGAAVGLVWAGESLPPNVYTKTNWLCENGHKIESSYTRVQGGTVRQCKQCVETGLSPSRKRGKASLTANDYTQLAIDRGFTWLGPLPENTKTRSAWRCNHGHEWQAMYHWIKYGKGCPDCARFRRNAGFVEIHYVEAAEMRGFTWLGPLPSNTSTVTEWMCSSNHRWWARYSNIVQLQSGCPECVGFVNGFPSSQPQFQLAEMLGAVVNYYVAPYSLDCAYPDEKICVEFDCWVWHNGREEHDAARDAYLIERGWRILRVKSERSLPSREDLADALALLEEQPYVEIVMPDWKGND